MGHSVYKHKIMDQRTIHNFVWIPLFIIGLVAVGLGVLWCVHPQPWLLDQPPNELILQTTFLDLFSAKINTYLPNYLTVIYRFLGWWLLTSGLLIIIYLRVTRLGTQLARNSLHMILFIVLIGLYYFVFSFIPQSPFVPLLYVLTFLLLCSVYFSTRMVK